MMTPALAYARAGFPVFPCNPTQDKKKGSKAPLTGPESAPGAQDGGHWLATTDLARVEAWWRRWPEALIGFPTGKRSATVVVDLDPREASVEAMLDAINIWCGGGFGWCHPDTGEIIGPAVAQTQSGGLHLYFRRGEQEFKNRANVFSGFIRTREALPELAHIDVRGDGGYVIAPPSRMEDGAAYAWLRRPAKDEAGCWLLPPLPPALRRVISGDRQPRVEPAPMAARRFAGGGDAAVYVRKTIDGVLDRVRTAGAGERNQLIFWGACRLGEFVRGGCLGESEAMSLMQGALPPGVSPGERKAIKTIESGLRNTKHPAFDPNSLRRGG
jgi:putative DNA primase/helicase